MVSPEELLGLLLEAGVDELPHPVTNNEAARIPDNTMDAFLFN